MEPPTVLYTDTRDGVNLAYAVSGEGRPLVFLPFPFNHLRDMWAANSRNRRLYEALATRFRLIQYDSRGHGLSQRGLPETFAMSDYVTDLETIIERLKLDRFLLFAPPLFCGVALRYASLHPERIEALLLHNAGLDPFGLRFEQLVESDWRMFIEMMAATFSIEERDRARRNYRNSVDQHDLLRIIEAGKRDPVVAASLSDINIPALVMWSGSGGLEAGSREIASALPNARMMSFHGAGTALFPDLYGNEGETPPVVTAIEQFVADLPTTQQPESRPHTLTAREIEVLRLVVQGKTNREIAEALVISEFTVVNHISHIFNKTGAENRAAATAYALRHGLA
jgi:DNA-binding CsgD family transcriptional regulator/pimeloyl-ACP methyl ester carboxylesterase